MSRHEDRLTPGRTQVESVTLGRRVYEEMHRRLMHGELKPGTRLSLRRLASDLGTSMQPVREAVGRLAAEEALEVGMGGRIMVPLLDRRTLDDLWTARVLLEGEAAARFAEHATIEAMDTIETAIDGRLAAIQEQGEVDELRLLMHAAGHAIAVNCGSPFLTRLIINLRLRVAPHIGEALGQPSHQEPGFARYSLTSHREVLRAARTRDAARARDMRRAALLSFKHYVYRRLGWD